MATDCNGTQINPDDFVLVKMRVAQVQEFPGSQTFLILRKANAGLAGADAILQIIPSMVLVVTNP